MAIKKIGIFCSGGDAPGMNAAIRASVRTAMHHQLEVAGINRGYEGMIDGEIRSLDAGDVANIIQRGGTILKTARSARFMDIAGREKAYEHLKKHQIDACIAIGGNGTFTGAGIFTKEFQIPFIGLPGTIDNDLYGTDFTIGFDSAVNTAMQAVDKIRDTAESHNRLFIIEVMGRASGYIALFTGLASGAFDIIYPEEKCSLQELTNRLALDSRRKKLFQLIINSEDSSQINTMDLANQIKTQFPSYDVRVTILGHMQRGGAPTANDRILASQLGMYAVEGLLVGKQNVMAGIMNQKIVFTSFEDCIQKSKLPDSEIMRCANIVSA